LKYLHQIWQADKSAPDPARGAYSAPPDPQQYVRGLLLWEGGTKAEGMEGRREGKKRKGEGREEGWREGFGPAKNVGLAPPIGPGL